MMFVSLGLGFGSLIGVLRLECVVRVYKGGIDFVFMLDMRLCGMFWVVCMVFSFFFIVW